MLVCQTTAVCASISSCVKHYILLIFLTFFDAGERHISSGRISIAAQRYPQADLSLCRATHARSVVRFTYPRNPVPLVDNATRRLERPTATMYHCKQSDRIPSFTIAVPLLTGNRFVSPAMIFQNHSTLSGVKHMTEQSRTDDDQHEMQNAHPRIIYSGYHETNRACETSPRQIHWDTKYKRTTLCCAAKKKSKQEDLFPSRSPSLMGNSREEEISTDTHTANQCCFVPTTRECFVRTGVPTSRTNARHVKT